jgi:hypothetical protein
MGPLIVPPVRARAPASAAVIVVGTQAEPFHRRPWLVEAPVVVPSGEPFMSETLGLG